MSAHASPSKQGITIQKLGRTGLLVLTLYIFMVSIRLLATSFRFLQDDPAFIGFLSEALGNPFVGLFMGLLATAILQSSSTTTSVIVMLAGSFGDISDPATISAVVPLILGANIGTSVTSTIVALGHIASKGEYRKAIAAASSHDFFNIFTVLVVFPLEIAFGILSKPAASLAAQINPSKGFIFNFMDNAVQPVANFLHGSVSAIPQKQIVPWISILFAMILLFLSLRGLIWLVKELIIGRTKNALNQALFGNRWKALGWGLGSTALIQSSSVTTSLVVPLVATGKVSLEKVFPFIIGANVGTTTTALLTAMVAADINPQAGLAVAFTHLFFNVYGMLIFFPIPKVRDLPVKMASALGGATYRNRLVGILYVVIVFFLLPFTLILLNRGTAMPKESNKAVEWQIPAEKAE